MSVLPRRAARDSVTQALEEAEAKLRDARADRKETERDRRMADAVEQLKRFFPGARQPPAAAPRGTLCCMRDIPAFTHARRNIGCFQG